MMITIKRIVGGHESEVNLGKNVNEQILLLKIVLLPCLLKMEIGKEIFSSHFICGLNILVILGQSVRSGSQK